MLDASCQGDKQGIETFCLKGLKVDINMSCILMYEHSCLLKKINTTNTAIIWPLFEEIKFLWYPSFHFFQNRRNTMF
jgi:hypothetical protein